METGVIALRRFRVELANDLTDKRPRCGALVWSRHPRAIFPLAKEDAVRNAAEVCNSSCVLLSEVMPPRHRSIDLINRLAE